MGDYYCDCVLGYAGKNCDKGTVKKMLKTCSKRHTALVVNNRIQTIQFQA